MLQLIIVTILPCSHSTTHPNSACTLLGLIDPRIIDLDSKLWINWITWLHKPYLVKVCLVVFWWLERLSVCNWGRKGKDWFVSWKSFILSSRHLIVRIWLAYTLFVTREWMFLSNSDILIVACRATQQASQLIQSKLVFSPIISFKLEPKTCHLQTISSYPALYCT